MLCFFFYVELAYREIILTPAVNFWWGVFGGLDGWLRPLIILTHYARFLKFFHGFLFHLFHLYLMCIVLFYGCDYFIAHCILRLGWYWDLLLSWRVWLLWLLYFNHTLITNFTVLYIYLSRVIHHSSLCSWCHFNRLCSLIYMLFCIG